MWPRRPTRCWAVHGNIRAITDAGLAGMVLRYPSDATAAIPGAFLAGCPGLTAFFSTLDLHGYDENVTTDGFAGLIKCRQAEP